MRFNGHALVRGWRGVSLVISNTTAVFFIRTCDVHRVTVGKRYIALTMSTAHAHPPWPFCLWLFISWSGVAPPSIDSRTLRRSSFEKAIATDSSLFSPRGRCGSLPSNKSDLNHSTQAHSVHSIPHLTHLPGSMRASQHSLAYGRCRYPRVERS